MLSADEPPPPHTSLRRKHVQQLTKTEMCKFFLRKNCGKGAKCPYAHSLAEVRDKPDLARTSMCQTFLQTGNCDSPSCSFAHNESQLRTTCGFFKTRMCRFAGSGRCKHGTACRFAHSKAELFQLEDATESLSLTAGNKTNQQDSFDITSDQSTGADTNASTQTPEGSGESGPEEVLKKDREKKQEGNRPARHCTTMMLSGVPHFLTQGALVSLLEDLTLGMRGAFDFFYCPWDPYEEKNLGYAIINFFSRSVAADFEKQWANKPLLQGTRGVKKLRMVPAALQGRAANLRHFSGFGLAHHVDPRFRPLVRAGPNEILRPMAISQEMTQQSPVVGNDREALERCAQHGGNVEPQSAVITPSRNFHTNFVPRDQQETTLNHAQHLASVVPDGLRRCRQFGISESQPAQCSYAENLRGLLQQIGRNQPLDAGERTSHDAGSLFHRLASAAFVNQQLPALAPTVMPNGLPSDCGVTLLQSLQHSLMSNQRSSSSSLGWNMV